MLRIRSELITDDHTGNLFIRYTPYLDATGPCASGQLSFAFWEAKVGDGEGIHLKAKQNALASAARVIAEIAADIASFPYPLS